MSEIWETTATVEDASHLKLHIPFERVPRGVVHVRVLMNESSSNGLEDAETSSMLEDEDDGLTEDERREATRLRQMTPEERAKDILAWLDSHKGGPGLSDWAVSRDSIYD